MKAEKFHDNCAVLFTLEVVFVKFLYLIKQQSLQNYRQYDATCMKIATFWNKTPKLL